jgi:hypothetical protein
MKIMNIDCVPLLYISHVVQLSRRTSKSLAMNDQAPLRSSIYKSSLLTLAEGLRDQYTRNRCNTRDYKSCPLQQIAMLSSYLQDLYRSK